MLGLWILFLSLYISCNFQNFCSEHTILKCETRKYVFFKKEKQGNMSRVICVWRTEWWGDKWSYESPRAWILLYSLKGNNKAKKKESNCQYLALPLKQKGSWAIGNAFFLSISLTCHRLLVLTKDVSAAGRSIYCCMRRTFSS